MIICNFCREKIIYKIESDKNAGEEAVMSQDLYEEIVQYIVENQDKFYRLAYSYVQNQEDALDAVQNAVCKALEHYTDLKNGGAVRTWMYRIVVNESLMILKDRKRMVAVDQDEQKEIPYEEKGYEPQDNLYDEINQLPEEVQTIVKLRFYEELSLKEIAQAMKMNLNTVKAKLYRGLKTLRVMIQE